ncbi:hypothetical protein SK128_021921, partial [Halocaridina rubra]
MQKWFKPRNGSGDSHVTSSGRNSPVSFSAGSAKGRASLKDTQAALTAALEAVSVKDNVIDNLEKQLQEKDTLIASLTVQLDKLKSVLPPPATSQRPHSINGQRITFRSISFRNQYTHSDHHNRASLQSDKCFNAPVLRNQGKIDGVPEGAEARPKRTAISAEPTEHDYDEYYDPDYDPVVVPKSQ